MTQSLTGLVPVVQIVQTFKTFVDNPIRSVRKTADFPHEATRTNMKQLVKEFFDRKDLPRAAKKDRPG